MTEGFDNVLQEHARNESKDPNTDRVILLGPERGFDWADEQLATADSRAAARARELLRLGIVPTGTRERIVGLELERDQARHILRDARNHADGRQQTASDIAVEGEISAGMLGTICPHSGPSDQGNEPPQKRIGELMDLIAAIRPIATVSDLRTAIAEVSPYRSELRNLMFRDTPLREDIAYRIDAALPRAKSKLGGPVTAFLGGLAGIALDLNDIARWKLLSRRTVILGSGGSAVFSLSSMAFEDLGGAEAVQDGMIMDSPYDLGEKYWFALAFRTPKIRVGSAKQLRDAIGKGARSPGKSGV